MHIYIYPRDSKCAVGLKRQQKTQNSGNFYQTKIANSLEQLEQGGSTVFPGFVSRESYQQGPNPSAEAKAWSANVVSWRTKSHKDGSKCFSRCLLCTYYLHASMCGMFNVKAGPSEITEECMREHSFCKMMLRSSLHGEC
jgi:hypothetical protein